MKQEGRYKSVPFDTRFVSYLECHSKIVHVAVIFVKCNNKRLIQWNNWYLQTLEL